MKAIATYSILFIILFLSCTTTQKEAGKLIEVQSKDSIIKLSSFIKNIKIIKLDTDSDLLISQIGKIQYIENKLYLSDMTGNCLFIFDDNGQLHKKIKRIGGGPGEYIRLMDFCITKNYPYILDFAKQTIIQYDNDFNFIKQIKYPAFGSKFIFQDGNYWIYNEPAGKKDDYQYIVVDSTEKKVKEFLPRGFTQHTYNWAGVNSFYENGNDIYLSPRYNDTIYSIEKDNIKIEYIIDFGADKFPRNENINDYDITLPDFNYRVKNNFYATSRYVIFDFNVKGKRKYCIYDKNNRKTICGEIKNDRMKNYRFFPRWGNDDYLIEEVSSDLILNDFKESFNNEMTKGLKPDDNPIIIIYETKN